MHELMAKNWQKLSQQQTEATRATADVAKHLGRLLKMKRTKAKTRTDILASGKNSATNVHFSEEIKSLISKTESQIPDVISKTEKTDTSCGSIQKTISDAIRAASLDEDSSKSGGDITEDIADELSSTTENGTTENVETILEKSSSKHSTSGIEATSKTSSMSSRSQKLTSSMDSFSTFAGKLSQQNVDEQVNRLRHKQHMLTLKENQLEKLLMIKLSDIEKGRGKESEEAIQKKKKKAIAEFKEVKASPKLLKESLKSEEKELLFVASQRKKLERDDAAAGAESFDLSLLSSSSSISASGTNTIKHFCLTADHRELCQDFDALYEEIYIYDVAP